MAKYSPNIWQNCATCEFWVGPRRPDESGATAEVDEAAQGKCILRGAHAEKYATNTCVGWRRWTALKA
ncbi:MAG: hypothetical protein AMJ81_01750 [Phycisphaerae bacterium SM23_33]|nr:MAG: hypothetical protein AMJ81_01750 [Phycisphaerae bacterium SM23_33]